VASCVQNIEKGPQVDLSPTVVIGLHDTYTLREGERSGEQSKGSHLDQAGVFEDEGSERMTAQSLEKEQRHLKLAYN
jgi:hypothetical protein